MISYIYPEPLPSKMARSVSAINTVCELSKIIETDLIYEKSGEDILDFYDLKCDKLNLFPIRKKFILRSNKIFNFNLKLNIKDSKDIFYVRHLKVAKELIRLNKRVVFEIHEIFSDINPKIYELEKFVYENAKGLVFVNKAVRDESFKKFDIKAPSKVIYNGCGFDVEYIKKDFSKIDEMFYIGSFQKWKGVDFLIEAVKGLDITLNIIGGQKQESKENINFLGFKSKNEVLEILKNSKLTIIPNLPYKESYYSVPIKLFEYMKTSNIVLSSSFKPIREILKDGENGFLFEPADIKSFKNQLQHILSLETKELEKISKNAYSTGKDFSWKNRAKKIVEFIKEIR